MKKLRIGFSAIIAIVALGLTIAAQAGAFESKKALAESDCFDVAPNAIQVKSLGCPDLTTPLDRQVDCTTAFNYSAGTNVYAIFALDPSDVVLNPATECPGGAKICCIQIRPVDATCPDQPEFNVGAGDKTYAVDFVRCKTFLP